MGRIPTVLSLLALDPCKLGTVEEFTVVLSEELGRRGWRSVLVFAQPVPDSLRARFDEAGAILGTPLEASGVPTYSLLWKVFRKYRPDVVHFHFYDFFSLLPILAWMGHAKLVVFTDHYRVPRPTGFITRTKAILWDRIILRLLNTQILAVSEHVKSALVDCFRMFSPRIQVVYNGVNIERFKPLEPRQIEQIRKELGLSQADRVIVSASDLRSEKGISDLLVAAKNLLASRPDAAFVIAGGGPLAESLGQQARQLEISERVRFVGLRSDINRLMGAADVVAVPSVWQEPAGLVVVEAMASARPVVATRVGGIPEYLANGTTGILVEPNAPDQLAGAILRLLDSPSEAKAMGEAGRERVEKYFSMDQWVANIVRRYENALGPEGKT